MYKRKIERVLYQWKHTAGHKPLVIKGVRQCGKTSSVLAFAQKNYKSVVYLDFREFPEYKKFFSKNLSPSTITMLISAQMPDVEFIPGNTCLIFDELQDCPEARGSLKYFHLDGKYDVICTGSLLGVNGYKSADERKNESQISIPVGFEEIIEMYPMDFEEWLWANGIKEEHFSYLHECFDRTEPVEEALHTRMRDLLLQYTVVGGMPEAVSTFLSTRQFGPLLAVQQRIVDDYKADMVKYAAAGDKARIRECFESIPSQLARENKKFSYAAVRQGGRGRDYLGCLQWIEDAGIIYRCHNLQATELPLSGNAINSEFKVYMADTGLLVSMLERGTQSDILQGDLLTYKGAIAENLLAGILRRMGRQLYYYRKDSGLELDFLIRYRGKCAPLECKAATGNAKSLKTVLTHPEKYHITQGIKLGDYNIGRSRAMLTIPMYMAFMLTDI